MTLSTRKDESYNKHFAMTQTLFPIVHRRTSAEVLESRILQCQSQSPRAWSPAEQKPGPAYGLFSLADCIVATFFSRLDGRMHAKQQHYTQ